MWRIIPVRLRTRPRKRIAGIYGAHRLEGSQTSPRRLDSGRLRRASRFSAYRTTSRYSFERIIRPKSCSRRLPRTTQRAAFSHSFRFVYTRTHRAANRWDVPGSRLFSDISVGLVMRRNLRGWQDTRQSGSPPGAGLQQRAWPTIHFEDENDDEDEYDFGVPTCG